MDMISNDMNEYLKPLCEVLKVEVQNLMAGSTSANVPDMPEGDGDIQTP
ncbi:MAG: hypothetical protein ACI4V5_03655 [Prevotella sp.]